MAWMNDMAAMMATPASYEPQFAQMTGPTTCKIGTLTLTKDDLLFAEHLLKPVCTKVSEISQAEGSYCTDKSAYLPALKAGDVVLIRQMSDSKFVVIEKVVSA